MRGGWDVGENKLLHLLSTGAAAAGWCRLSIDSPLLVEVLHELHILYVWWNHCEVCHHCFHHSVFFIYWVDYCLLEVFDTDRVWVLFEFIAPFWSSPTPCFFTRCYMQGVRLGHHKSMVACCLWEFFEHMVHP